MGGHSCTLLCVSIHTHSVGCRLILIVSDNVDGQTPVRMVFGTTTCDRQTHSVGETMVFTLYKSEDHPKRNVFVNSEWIHTADGESLNEDIKFGFCLKKANVTQNVPNDIALVKLPHPVKIDLAKNNINTICVRHSTEFKQDLNSRHVSAYAAGFGLKDIGLSRGLTPSERAAILANSYQPYLSFIRYAVFGYTTTVPYPDGGDQKVIIQNPSTTSLSAFDLDDKLQRDTQSVS